MDETIGRTELVDAVARDAGCPEGIARQVLESLQRQIAYTLKRGDRVRLPGFGAFERRQRARRTARNIHTGEPVRVAATKVPAFKPGDTFRRIVRGETTTARSGWATAPARTRRTSTTSATAKSSSARSMSRPGPGPVARSDSSRRTSGSSGSSARSSSARSSSSSRGSRRRG